jgi:hypothetical protein
MNILFDPLPYRVEVGGVAYQIETDFRAGLEFALMIEKGEQNAYKLLTPFFSRIPPDIAGAFEAVVFFHFRGNMPETNEKQKKEKPCYSYEVDADAIFADFWQFYNIDLTTERLHWYVFLSLLEGLPEESSFKKRIYYRTCNLKDLPKKERERIVNIRKRIAIEQEERGGKMTLEERNAQMLAYIKKREKETNKGGGVNG